VSGETTPLHTGTTTLPTKPFEKFVFGRGISGRRQRAGNQDKKAVPVATA
jgi:hypothetical protein